MGSILDIGSGISSRITKKVGFFSIGVRPSDFPAAALGSSAYAMMDIIKYSNLIIIKITNIQDSGIPNHISGFYAPHTGLLWGNVY